ncbi:MAG TPA: tetratricopeptide repeat protein [Fredinandcohnia sp.]|nr:tetratricopeptide repeat protein [Fredinandcohnia sp.]
MRRTALLFVLVLVPVAARAEILRRPDRDVEAGIAALRAGEAEAALEHFERAARRRPQDGRIHLDRGLALQALGRFDEATEAFAQALASGGASREALHGLGHAHAARGDLDAAIASFRTALERDPEDAVARKNLEALLRSKRKQQRAEPQSEGQQEGEKEGQEGADSEGSEDAGKEEAGEGDPSETEAGSAGEDEGETEEGGVGEDEGAEDGAPSGASEEGEVASDGSDERAGEGADGESAGESPAGAMGEEGEGREEGASVQQVPAGPAETERILDALKAREKSLPLFRGPQRKGRRTDAEKDW